MNQSRRLWFICLLLFCTVPICVAQESGTIQGVVIDADGKPLAGANVFPLLKGEVFVGHRISRSEQTASDGRFLITHLSWGTYLLVAEKQGSGYPDTRLAFYSNLQGASATISADHPRADVTINLGPQAGWLNLSVVDATSGNKVTSATVTLRRVTNPKLWVTTAATPNRVAVPPDTEVQVVVDAYGYVTWPTDNSQFVINLRSNEERQLKVQLVPKS